MRHVGLVGADDDHVVAVMRHGGGDGAIGVVAEARHEGVDHRPGARCRSTSAIWQTSWRAVHGDQPVVTASSRSSALVGAWFSTTPMTRARTALLPAGAGDVEIGGRERRPSCTVSRAEAGIGEGRQISRP